MATFSGKFWCKKSSNSKKKWSQWNYYTKPMVELPLAKGGKCCLALDFCIFMHLLHVLRLLLIILSLCNTLRQLLVPNSYANFFKNPVLDAVPAELPLWNCPWPRGGVLLCSSILTFFIYLLQLYEPLVIIHFFAILSGNFWYQI